MKSFIHISTCKVVNITISLTQLEIKTNSHQIESIEELYSDFIEKVLEGILLLTEDDDKDKLGLSLREVFFGKCTNMTIYDLNQSTMKKRDTNHSTEFGLLILNTASGELYKSLETYFESEIEELDFIYGEKAKKIRRKTSITQIPKMLTIFLKRQQFDKDKGVFEIKTEFNFTEELYIDQFVKENKDKSHCIKTLTKKKELIERKKKLLFKSIRYLEEAKKALDDQIKTMKEECEREKQYNKENESEDRDNDDGENDFFCEKVQMISTDINDLKNLENSIENELQKIKTRLEQLETQKKTIERETKELEQNQKIKYRLCGSIIKAGNGHYSLVLYNQNKKEWIWFNDGKVEKLNKYKGLGLIRGEKTDKIHVELDNAQFLSECLFYVKEDFEINLDGYFSPETREYIPIELLKLVEEENKVYLGECQHELKNQVQQKIFNDYIQRMNLLRGFQADCYEDPNDNSKLPIIPEFEKLFIQDIKESFSIIQWAALKVAFEKNDSNIDFMLKNKENYYYQELKKLLLDRSYYPFESLNISKKDLSLFRQREQDHEIIKEYFLLLDFIFHGIKEEKWEKVIVRIAFLHQQIYDLERNNKNYEKMFNFAEHLFQIISRKFCKLIKKHTYRTGFMLLIKKGQIEEALKYLKILVHYFKSKYVKISQEFRKEIEIKLYDAIYSGDFKKLNPDHARMYTKYIENFENPTKPGNFEDNLDTIVLEETIECRAQIRKKDFPPNFHKKLSDDYEWVRKRMKDYIEDKSFGNEEEQKELADFESSSKYID